MSLLMGLVAAGALVTSCESEKVEKIDPEISVPEGETDYFATQSMNFECDGSSQFLNFTTNLPWEIRVLETRGGEAWCTVDPASGEAGTHRVKVEVKENNTYDDRNVVISLKIGDEFHPIFVNQKQLDALTLTSNRFEVPQSGGSIEVEVKANVDFEVEIPEEYESWIHQSKEQTRALTENKIRFDIDGHEDYEKREGEIIVKGNGKEEVIRVFQTGEGILTLTSNTFNLSRAEQDITIEVSSNFEYDVDMPEVDWIEEKTTEEETKVETRSVSSHTLILHVKENQGYDERSAQLRIYDKNSDLSETITITQNQKDGLLIGQKIFEFDDSGDRFTVNINWNVVFRVKFDCDWIKEVKNNETRAMKESNRTFEAEAITDLDVLEREGRIIFYNTKADVSEEVIVKQHRIFYFNPFSISVMQIEQKQLTLVNPTDQSVTWESSDPSIVTVNNTGMIEGQKVGTANVFAKTTDGKYAAKCFIEVIENTDFQFAAPSQEVMEAETAQLNLKNETGKSVVWTSSDPTIATVSSTGVVEGFKLGTVTITAKTTDGRLSRQCTVKVTKNTKYQFEKETVEVMEAETAQLNLKNETGKSVVWTSSDPTIATVSSTGVVEGFKLGTVTITAKTTDGRLSRQCTVKVTENTKYQFEKKTVEVMEAETVQLNLKNETGKSVVWTSSDPSVATVDNTGLVSGIKGGTVEIIATTTDGRLSRKCTVLVIGIEEILNRIKVNCSGISMMSTGGTSTTTTTWEVLNNSPVDITLKSMQLKILGFNVPIWSNEKTYNKVISPNSSVEDSFTYNILYLVAECYCKIEIRGKLYTIMGANGSVSQK